MFIIICITLLERKWLHCRPESLLAYICDIKPTVYCAFVATPAIHYIYIVSLHSSLMKSS